MSEMTDSEVIEALLELLRASDEAVRISEGCGIPYCLRLIGENDKAAAVEAFLKQAAPAA